MSVTQDNINEINKQKDIILDALSELDSLIQSTGDTMSYERFRSYVKGGVEQAMIDFGMHNTCIESIVKDLEDELEEEPSCEFCDELRSECNC